MSPGSSGNQSCAAVPSQPQLDKGARAGVSPVIASAAHGPPSSLESAPVMTRERTSRTEVHADHDRLRDAPFKFALGVDPRSQPLLLLHFVCLHIH